MGAAPADLDHAAVRRLHQYDTEAGVLVHRAAPRLVRYNPRHRTRSPIRRRPQTRSGGDIGIHGSLTLARSLLAEQLVDELRLVVAPSLAEDWPPIEMFEIWLADLLQRVSLA